MDNRYAKTILEKKRRELSDNLQTLNRSKVDYEKEIKRIEDEVGNISKSLVDIEAAIDALS